MLIDGVPGEHETEGEMRLLSCVPKRHAFVQLQVFIGHQIIYDTDINLDCLMYFGVKQRLIILFIICSNCKTVTIMSVSENVLKNTGKFFFGINFISILFGRGTLSLITPHVPSHPQNGSENQRFSIKADTLFVWYSVLNVDLLNFIKIRLK